NRVASIIEKMSDKEKIGQLVMASNEHGDTEMPNEFIRKMIQDYFVGSMIVYGNRDVVSQAEYNNQVQEFAGETRLNIPLFVTADLENGAAQRVPDDATTLPRQMALGQRTAWNTLRRIHKLQHEKLKHSDLIGVIRLMQM